MSFQRNQCPARLLMPSSGRKPGLPKQDPGIPDGCYTADALNNILSHSMLICTSTVQHASIIGFGAGGGGEF
jgi:hypothetical protein